MKYNELFYRLRQSSAETRKGCENTDCRMWIDFESEQNCCLISIEEKTKDGKDKGLTLHEVAERLDINYLKLDR